MQNKPFFEIPIYRSSRAEYDRECKKEAQERRRSLLKSSGVSREQKPEVYRLMEEAVFKKHGTWFYNQVVGWIRLSALGTQIRGEYYFIDKKRIHRHFSKKRMILQGKAFELSISSKQSSEEIYRNLCNRLNQLKQEKPFKGRFINIELLVSVGPHINWRSFLKLDS